MATSPLARICSHLKIKHTDGIGSCIEPTNRCQCAVYSELCPVCRHGYYSHNGTNGICMRTVQKTKAPCGCTQYPTNA